MNIYGVSVHWQGMLFPILKLLQSPLLHQYKNSPCQLYRSTQVTQLLGTECGDYMYFITHLTCASQERFPNNQ